MRHDVGCLGSAVTPGHAEFAKGDDVADPLNAKKPRYAQARQRLANWVRELGVSDPELLMPNHIWRHFQADRRPRWHQRAHARLHYRTCTQECGSGLRISQEACTLAALSLGIEEPGIHNSVR